MNKAHGLSAENLVAALPPALRQDPSAVALAEAMASVLAKRPDEIDRLRLYPEIGRLDEAVLDTLAYDFKVDWWDSDYDLGEKRRTMQSSWKVHKLLGTKAAVETGLRAIYPESRAEPWFDYEDGDGKPYHFRLHIDLSNEVLVDGKPANVLERVQYYQSLRDHIDEFRYTIEAKQPAELHMGGGAGVDTTLGVREQEDVFDFRDGLFMGGGFGVSGTLGAGEREDVFDFRDGLFMGGGVGMDAALGAHEQGDVFRFQDGLHLGGRFGVIDTLPQPESMKPPRAVTILRTGGVCTIISNA